MNDIMKRCLSLGYTFSALTGMRRSNAAQGGLPLSKTPASPPIPLPPAAVPELPPVSSFSGTVVRDGSRFALRELDGTLFALDSTGRAWPFEGEEVAIKGYFNPESRLLHICAIEAVDDLRAEAV